MESSRDNPTPSAQAMGGKAGEAFVQLLTGEQTRLLQYISMLLGDIEAAHNVLQETNLVLWRKSDEFEPGTSFTAWSKSVAYWQVRAYLRDRKRDRLVFSDEVVSQLTNRSGEDEDGLEKRLALRHCLKGINKRNRDLINTRYEGGESIKAIADASGRSESAIKVSLLRIRKALLACIQRKMSETGA